MEGAGGGRREEGVSMTMTRFKQPSCNAAAVCPEVKNQILADDQRQTVKWPEIRTQQQSL